MRTVTTHFVAPPPDREIKKAARGANDPLIEYRQRQRANRFKSPQMKLLFRGRSQNELGLARIVRRRSGVHPEESHQVGMPDPDHESQSLISVLG